MGFKNKKSISGSVLFAVSTVAVVVAVFMVLDGELISALVGFARPFGSEFEPWQVLPLMGVSLVFWVFGEKLNFKALGVLTVSFLLVWYAAAGIANQVFEKNLLFVPIFWISILSLVGIQSKKFWQIDSKLNKRLTKLISSGSLMGRETGGSRLESGLQLLRTVLPLSEVIVFQYTLNGELDPIGRTRNTNVKESLNSRQDAWRQNVKLCEKALETHSTVVEADENNSGAAKIALPLIAENVVVGGLFVNIKENFEHGDKYLLEGFSEQLARDFQRKKLQGTPSGNRPWTSCLLEDTSKNQLDIINLISGLIKEQFYGVVATRYIKEAHAIAYLDGTIAYINSSMRHLAKLKFKELGKINLFDLLDRFRTDVFNEPGIAIRKVLQTGNTFQSELFLPDDGATLDMEITLVKTSANPENIYDSETPKKPVCFLITFRDVTRRKENEKLRSDMVNLISHELRTPITSIQGFAEVLVGDDSLSEDSREYLLTIAGEAQRASNLLSNFLTVANLQQSDKQEFHKSPVKVDKIIEEVVENMRGTAKQKRIRLVEKFEDQVPPIAADHGLLTKAISHLIDNAIRYSSERSSVIISTILESDFLRVEVEDRGYGIPSDEQEKIWQKFYRVSRDGQDKEEESTGLGLSLVKEIVEKHAGVVGVESEVGRGSKFSFKIPRL